MNNNRGNNNRRRGRGNNRPQGGGQQLNRIDSRARGNAPQLLEKYRKLAHDAHLNGDRVTEEYYLQFADHYFRVLADSRSRQEEQRQRRDDRWQEGGEEGEDAAELAGGEQGYDQGYGRVEQYDRSERGNRADRGERDERQREDRPRDDRPRDDRQRDDRPRQERQPRREREFRADEPAETGLVADEPETQPASVYEPAENPFVRDNRPSRGLRPRREGRVRAEADSEVPAGFDPSILPPAFGAAREEFAGADESASVDEAPAPKRRGRKPKAAAEAVEEG